MGQDFLDIQHITLISGSLILVSVGARPIIIIWSARYPGRTKYWTWYQINTGYQAKYRNGCSMSGIISSMIPDIKFPDIRSILYPVPYNNHKPDLITSLNNQDLSVCFFTWNLCAENLLVNWEKIENEERKEVKMTGYLYNIYHIPVPQRVFLHFSFFISSCKGDINFFDLLPVYFLECLYMILCIMCIYINYGLYVYVLDVFKTL